MSKKSKKTDQFREMYHYNLDTFNYKRDMGKEELSPKKVETTNNYFQSNTDQEKQRLALGPKQFGESNHK